VFDYQPPLLHDTWVKGEPVEYRMIGAEASVDGLGFELIQPVSGPSNLPGVSWTPTVRASNTSPA